MRTFHRLHLFLFCFYGRVPPTLRVLLSRVANFCTCCLVETSQAHQKQSGLDYLDVRDPLVIFIIARRRPVCLWWTWGESHPRPRHFSKNQFTTIPLHRDFPV